MESIENWKKGGHYKGKIGRPSKQAKRNATMIANMIGRPHIHVFS